MLKHPFCIDKYSRICMKQAKNEGKMRAQKAALIRIKNYHSTI